MIAKKYKIFNKKTFVFHKAFGTMIDARKEAKMLKEKGYSIRMISRSSTSTGCYLYKYKK